MKAAIGTIGSIYRYPVKSMRGEKLEKALIGKYGIAGDRRFALRDLTLDRSFTARIAPELLNYTTEFISPPEIHPRVEIKIKSPDGQIFVSRDPDIETQFSKKFTRRLAFLHYPEGKFDDLPLHLIIDSTLQKLNEILHQEISYLRFRPNFLVNTDHAPPFIENEWIGKQVRIGDESIIEIQKHCVRCVIPTIDPDTLEKSPSILKTIVEKNQGIFGVYAVVTKSGWVKPGDPLFFI